MRQELLPDAGSIALPPSWTIAHVAQETPAVASAGHRLRARRRPRTARDRGRAGRRGTRPRPSTAKRWRTCTIASTTSAATVRARAPRRCSRAWAFPKRGTAIPSPSFSGGWRMRLNLAQALMCRSDLLLLDEPTNHLDLDAVLWLEDWLAKYPGTLLLITHDRDFLDGVVDEIVHVNARKLHALHRQLRAVRTRARASARAAAGVVRQAAAAGGAPAIVHRPLSREGHQGQAGAEPDQGAGANGTDRGRARGLLRSSSSFHPSTRPRGNSCCWSTRRWATRASRPVLARRRLGHSRRRSHRIAGTQRRGQVDAAQGDRGHAGAAAGKAVDGAEPAARLFRTAPGRATARGLLAAVASAADRARGARTGTARLPGRLRLSRRHGHVRSRAASPAAKRRV